MIESVEITRFLHNWKGGDDAALSEMLPFVYAELSRIAHHYRAKENGDHTLQTTEIINEVYLKLRRQSATEWQNRSHFFAVASVVMRNLLVDYARTRKYKKRGSGAEKVSLDDVAVISNEPDEKIIALDEALKNLAKYDERKSRIVELRYFGGLSAQETAEALGISEITVKREWLKAKAWLYNELAEGK